LAAGEEIKMQGPKSLMQGAIAPGMPPQELRRRVQHDRGADMQARRAIVGVSLVGMAAMGIVTLYQTGVIRHLPDPLTRWPHFHSDKVNGSPTAFGYGMPDGPITLAAHAVNLALAAAGPPDRHRRSPWLPLLATLLSGAQAAVAAKYLFYQMPYVDEAWCPYCVTDALTHFATLACTLPETARVLGALADES
jgi:uncharacterized membrane protein